MARQKSLLLCINILHNNHIAKMVDNVFPVRVDNQTTGALSYNTVKVFLQKKKSVFKDYINIC